MLPATYRFSVNLEEFNEQNAALTEQGYSLVELGIEDAILHTRYIAETENNAILSSEDFTEFVEIIPSQREAGYELVNVRYSDLDGEGIWVGEFRNDVIPTTHFYTDNLVEFTTYAGEQFEQNRGLIDLEYGDGTISAIFANTPRFSGYVSSEDYDEFLGLVEERTVISPLSFGSGGADLLDVEYIDGTYIGVLGDFLGASSYAFNYSDYNEFQAAIQSQRVGQTLVDVEYINGAWFGVLNNNGDIIDPLSQEFTTPSDSAITQAQISGEAFSFGTFVTPNI